MAKRTQKLANENPAFARLIRREFDRMNKHLASLTSKRELAQFRAYVDGGFRATTATLGAIHEEVLGLRILSADIAKLRMRIMRVERHLGLTKREAH